MDTCSNPGLWVKRELTPSVAGGLVDIGCLGSVLSLRPGPGKISQVKKAGLQAPELYSINDSNYRLLEDC